MADRGILQVNDLVKKYMLKRHWWNKPEEVTAVDHVSFAVCQGESFGLVGESGCGKSTLAKMLVMLEEPDAGTVMFNGRCLSALKAEEQRLLRQELQIVWQDSSQALNPRFCVQDALLEPLLNFGVSGAESSILDTLSMVGLSTKLLGRYPRELSGGERQRLSIARALILKPRMIIFDEATTGLDATLQFRFLQLIKELKREMELTYLVITHNLELIPFITDRFAVMRGGKIVEIRNSADAACAEHPYTKSLWSAIPAHHPRLKKW